VDNPHIRLLFYAVAVSGACVEILGSIEVGVWHPSVYWAAMAGIIPCGLLGILRISKLCTDPAYEFQARDPAKPTVPSLVFAMAPSAVSESLRFGPPVPPMLTNRRPLTLTPQSRWSDGPARARRDRVVEKC